METVTNFSLRNDLLSVSPSLIIQTQTPILLNIITPVGCMYKHFSLALLSQFAVDLYFEAVKLNMIIFRISLTNQWVEKMVNLQHGDKHVV